MCPNVSLCVYFSAGFVASGVGDCGPQFACAKIGEIGAKSAIFAFNISNRRDEKCVYFRHGFETPPRRALFPWRTVRFQTAD